MLLGVKNVSLDASLECLKLIPSSFNVDFLFIFYSSRFKHQFDHKYGGFVSYALVDAVSYCSNA